MLKEFQKKFGLTKGGSDKRFLDERGNMMYEELCEYYRAIKNNDPENVLDGLVDLVYFAIGTATLLEWDFNEAFRRVHAANMKKVRAYTERSAVDLIKPNGWEAADLSDLV
jgi:NTP pyrophosphatase (non-canonical NTP hydrolase)